MKSYSWYLLAAFSEIGGCFAYWAWLRMSKSVFWTVPGTLLLLLFAYALTKVESNQAGRAYAAYGGVYVLSSVVWLWAVEKSRPDRWDLLGAAICIVGSLVILYGPRPQ